MADGRWRITVTTPDWGQDHLSAEAVVAFAEAGAAAGGTVIEDPAGPRDTPFGVMHLAYLRDPSGNKICAVHRPS